MGAIHRSARPASSCLDFQGGNIVPSQLGGGLGCFAVVNLGDSLVNLIQCLAQPRLWGFPEWMFT